MAVGPYNQHRESTEPLKLLLETQNTVAKEKDAQILTLTQEFDALQKQMLELSQRALEQERKNSMIIQEGFGLRERTLELERRNDVLKTQMAETGPEMVGLRHGLMEAKEMLVEAQAELLKVAREKEDLQKAGLELNNRNHELVTQLTEVKAECQSAARKHTTLTDALQTEVFELIKRNGDLQVQLEGLRMKRTAIAHREAIISCERQIESMRERAQKDREDLESQNHRYKDKIVELEDKLSEALRRVALSCPWCSAGGSNLFDGMVPLCGTDQFVGNSSGHEGAFSAPERLI